MEANIQTIMEAALQQGIWAALYIYTTVRGIIGESETIHHVIHVQFPPDAVKE